MNVKHYLGKHVSDSTTTERWSNGHVTDLGDSDFSAFKQTRYPHIMYDIIYNTYN